MTESRGSRCGPMAARAGAEGLARSRIGSEAARKFLRFLDAVELLWFEV
jgi:hypothetical protein